jgi:putative hydrolase of the HAD superfamily
MPMCGVGLADYFNFALCAEDIGIAKPDSRLFHEALQRGGVEASAAVHIGDHPGDDIAGAQQRGFVRCGSTGGQGLGRGQAPDAQIHSLAELPELLRSWNWTDLQWHTEFVSHMKKPAATAGFSRKHGTDLNRPAAVLVVRLLGRVCNHIGLDLDHFAAFCEEFFHRTGQRIALFVLGLDARQFVYRNSGLGLAFGSRNRNIVTAVVVSNVFRRRFKTFLGVVFVTYFSSSFSRSSSLMFYLMTCEKQISYSPASPSVEVAGKNQHPPDNQWLMPHHRAKWRGLYEHRHDHGARPDKHLARSPSPSGRPSPANSAGSPGDCRLKCAGRSSGLRRCRSSRTRPCGTSELKSRSVTATAGSAFSLTVNEAEVCCSHRCNRPTRHAFNSGKPASNSSAPGESPRAWPAG